MHSEILHSAFNCVDACFQGVNVYIHVVVEYVSRVYVHIYETSPPHSMCTACSSHRVQRKRENPQTTTTTVATTTGVPEMARQRPRFPRSRTPPRACARTRPSQRHCQLHTTLARVRKRFYTKHSFHFRSVALQTLL